MEMANHWPGGAPAYPGIRRATPADRPELLDLLHHAAFSHLHLDWRPPADWIGQPAFVLLPAAEDGAVPTLAERIFRPRNRIAGCLAVTADPPPAAWMRVVALAGRPDPRGVLAALLDAAVPSLQAHGVDRIGWLAAEPWPLPWLPDLGFQQTGEIETYHLAEWPSQLPPGPANLLLRPVTEADFAQLEAIETAAFAPLWRLSAAGMRLAWQQASSFDVAWWQGQPAGFQFSTLADGHAHLARLTVSPTVQGHGIGSALLSRAIDDFRRRGCRQMTLNTQVDNRSSQRLYLKFGFRPGGQRLPIWVRSI